MDNEEAAKIASRLKELEDKIKSGGFDDVDSLLKAQKEAADEAAKLKEHNEKAAEIIGRHGNEIGTLKGQVAELTTKLEAASGGGAGR